MPNVLVRDLPDDVHVGLQRQAEAAGQSLQQYLSTELAKIAKRPSMAEVLERIGRHRGGRVAIRTAVDDLEQERSVT